MLLRRNAGDDHVEDYLSGKRPYRALWNLVKASRICNQARSE